jgi:Zn-dependent metalloprotease
MSEKPRYFHGSGGGRFFFLISLGMSLTFLTWPIFGASRQDVDNPRPEKIVFHSTYQTPEIVSGYFAASSAATMEQKSYDFFAARNELFKINRPDQELDLIKQSTDDLGLTHLRFQQSYNGIRVWGCQTIVHFEDDNTIYLVGGQTIASPDLNTVPSLDESAASDEAVSSLKSESLPDQISTESEPVIYPNDGDPKLAWLVTVARFCRCSIGNNPAQVQ